MAAANQPSLTLSSLVLWSSNTACSESEGLRQMRRFLSTCAFFDIWFCVLPRAATTPQKYIMSVAPRLLKAKQLWKTSRAVCFDVDSTVVTEEGIDVLAEFCGAGPAVAEWTKKAMGGSVPFHVALEARLNLIKPSQEQVASCLKKHPLVFTPGMRDLMSALKTKGKTVYLVSGGFRQMIHPIAEELDIPFERVFANNILFNTNGSYAGFDVNEPTSRAGGKAVVVEGLKKSGLSPVIMVGDGATDMEANADAFVGFGGIVVRENVKNGADWFAMSTKEMIEEL